MIEVPEIDDGEEAISFECSHCGGTLWAVSFGSGHVEIIEDERYDASVKGEAEDLGGEG